MYAAYAELAVTTNFSFLRGASHAEELVAHAKRLGLSGIGIADRNSVAGVVRAHMAAQTVGLLLSLGKRRAEKGDCLLGIADLLDFIAGLNLIVMAPPRIDAAALRALLGRLEQAAPEKSIRLATSMLYRGDDGRRCARLAEIADQSSVPLIAINDVLYHAP